MVPQMMRHIPIDALDPTHDRRRCVDAFKAYAFKVQYRCKDSLYSDEVRLQYLRDAVIRVDKGLELVVPPA